MAYGDGMGRIIEEISGMTGDIKDVLRDALSGGTKKETKVQDESAKSDEERNDLLDEIKDLLESMDSNFSKQMKADKSRVTGKGKFDVEVSIDGDDPGKAGKKDAKEYSKEFSKTANTVTRAAGLLGGGQALSISSLFKGAFKEQIEFGIGMKQIQFETKGVTRAAQGAIDPWTELKDVAATTGMFLVDFQAGYMKALKSGIKSQKETVKVLTAAGNLSTMIGVDAAQTSDLFHQWHQTLGFSGNQTAQLSRDIRNIALETGITGDNLWEAVKASEKYLTNMRNAGTLTVEGTKNIIKMVAEAKKLGVEDQIGKIIDAASGPAKLFFETSKKTQAFLFTAAGSVGKLNELTEGTLLNTRSGSKALAEGYDEVFKRYSGGKSLDELKDLDPAKLKSINMALHSAFGTSAEEMRREREVHLNSSKSLSENLERISKELDNQNLTVAERNLLEKERSNLVLGQSLSLMGMFDERLGEAGLSFTDALAKGAKDLSEDQEKDLATIGEKFGLDMDDPINMFKAASLSTAEELKKAGGKDFTAAISDAIMVSQATGDSSGVRELTDEMNKEQMRMAIAEKAAIDPLTNLAQGIKEVNEKILNVTRGILGGFVGIGIIIAAGFANLAMTLGGGIIGNKLKELLLGKIFGGGVKGGAKGAAMDMGALAQHSKKAKRLAMLDKLAPKVSGGPIKGTGGGMLRRMSQMDGVMGKLAKKTRVAKVGISKLAGKAGLGSLIKAGGVAVKGIPVVGWIITGLMAGFEGLEQGAKSAAAANEIFGVSQEKVTGSMTTAADNAGFITGAIDSLTFGLAGWLLELLGLGDVLGPTGSLTKGIAQFFDKFQFLSKLFSVTLLPLKLLWAVLKGLWGFIKNIFIGLWEGIQIAIEPIIELFSSFDEVLNEIFGGGGGGDKFASGMEKFEAGLVVVADILSWVGTAIGYLFKGIGFFIKAALTPFIAGFKILAKVFKAIWDWDFDTLWDDILGILYEQFVNLWGKLFGKEAVEGVVRGFKGIFYRLWQWVYDGVAGAFKKAWDYLLTFIPDIVKPGKKGDEARDTAKEVAITTTATIVAPGAVGGLALAKMLTKKKVDKTVDPGLGSGSTNILSDGFAKLHKGEMVIPALQAGLLRGADADDPGGFFTSMFDPLGAMEYMDPLGLMESNPIIASLSRFAGLDPEREVKKNKVTKNSKAQTSEDKCGEERAMIQREIRDLMAKLVDLQQKESIASVGLSEQQKEQSTRTNTKPLGPKKFGKLQKGKYGQASQQFNLTGLV
jgi:hypothetical protein